MGRAVINMTFSGVSALRTKKRGHSHLSSLTGPCLCARPPLFSLCTIVRGGLAVSHRARVQRGESATARCASTEDHQLPPPPLLHTSTKGSGLGCPLLRASNEHFLNVRVLRARRAPGRALLILSRAHIARTRETNRHSPLLCLAIAIIPSVYVGR